LDETLFLTPISRCSARDIVAQLIGWKHDLVKGAKQADPRMEGSADRQVAA
jgi:hypothetical protein